MTIVLCCSTSAIEINSIKIFKPLVPVDEQIFVQKKKVKIRAKNDWEL